MGQGWVRVGSEGWVRVRVRVGSGSGSGSGRAWGGDATVTDIAPVCATERDAHASENLFVLAVNRGAVRDEAAPYLPISRP